MNWLAIDIGGANIKLADGRGFALSSAFALWKHHKQLASELRTLIAEAPPSDHLAITMTGELADCFPTRRDGVEYIVQAAREAADRRHTRVYLANGTLVTPQVAVSRWQLAAASNWHALARFAGRYVKKERALLIDVGSTTCDIVPLENGVPVAKGATDGERMIAGELAYTGVERSPVCAIVKRVPYRQGTCPVAQELFATTRDAYLVLGQLAEDPRDRATADGRPATRKDAIARLARALCLEGEEFGANDAEAAAHAIADAQCEIVAAAMRQVLAALAGPPGAIVMVGQGEFLIERVCRLVGLTARRVSLAAEAGVAVSRCGPAHALAVLARETTAP